MISQYFGTVDGHNRTANVFKTCAGDYVVEMYEDELKQERYEVFKSLSSAEDCAEDWVDNLK